MSSGHQAAALYALFHNATMYTKKNNDDPVSHIYSGVVMPGKRGLDVKVYDYDGHGRGIRLNDLDVKFDLAAFVPVDRDTVHRLDRIVEQINRLGINGNWPFYFSRDMRVVPDRELVNEYAIAPEGHIDPPHKYQNKKDYRSKSNSIVARINCVRMTFLCAQIAGINIGNIAGLNPFSDTGEEVRDALLTVRDRLVSRLGQRDSSIALVNEFTTSSKAGVGSKGADVVLDKNGLCVVTSKSDLRINTLSSALERRMDGKPLYEWMTASDTSTYRDQPMRIPAYLKEALSCG